MEIEYDREIERQREERERRERGEREGQKCGEKAKRLRGDKKAKIPPRYGREKIVLSYTKTNFGNIKYVRKFLMEIKLDNRL